MSVAYLYPNAGRYDLVWHSLTSWRVHGYGPWRITKRDCFLSLPVFNGEQEWMKGEGAGGNE